MREEIRFRSPFYIANIYVGMTPKEINPKSQYRTWSGIRNALRDEIVLYSDIRNRDLLEILKEKEIVIEQQSKTSFTSSQLANHYRKQLADKERELLRLKSENAILSKGIREMSKHLRDLGDNNWFSWRDTALRLIGKTLSKAAETLKQNNNEK